MIVEEEKICMGPIKLGGMRLADPNNCQTNTIVLGILSTIHHPFL
jgi:hypothetical protein